MRGNCPMGCGRSLVFFREDQEVRCTHRHCPDPLAVMKILTDPETEHVAKIDHDGQFVALLHPLSERIRHSVLDCDLVAHVVADVLNDNAPEGEGRYRVIFEGHDPVSSSLHAKMCHWEKVSD